MLLQPFDVNRLLQLLPDPASELNAIGLQRNIGPDDASYHQGERRNLRIVGLNGKTLSQCGPATIFGVNHDADDFPAAGTDMPRIRGYRAASVGPHIFYDQRSAPLILDHKVMGDLDAFENGGEVMLHLGYDRTRPNRVCGRGGFRTAGFGRRPCEGPVGKQQHADQSRCKHYPIRAFVANHRPHASEV